MNKKFYNILILCLLVVSSSVYAGNPDRQGEAGAGELLFNPWARSAGFHSMNTSMASGVEAMRINVAGIGNTLNGSELIVGQTRLFEGADLTMNAVGYTQAMGENGALAFSLTALSFGDIEVTTTGQPEGTGGTFSPGFYNIGLGYAYTYESEDSDNSISVGALVRGVVESLPDVSAFGIAIDAGVQYATGEDKNFKLGVSLRNIGGPMDFGGEGLSVQSNDPENPRKLTYDVRVNEFEMPSMLNIGTSYDYHASDKIIVTGLANFTSNAFSSDQIGGGVELSYNKQFALRAGYRHELAQVSVGEENIYSGLSLGGSVRLPLRKEGGSDISIDYAFRSTNTFKGTHNFSVGLFF